MPAVLAVLAGVVLLVLLWRLMLAPLALLLALSEDLAGERGLCSNRRPPPSGRRLVGLLPDHTRATRFRAAPAPERIPDPPALRVP